MEKLKRGQLGSRQRGPLPLQALAPDDDISGLRNEPQLLRGWGCTAEGGQRCRPPHESAAGDGLRHAGEGFKDPRQWRGGGP